jgi:peptide/nickel transport system permease protein
VTPLPSSITSPRAPSGRLGDHPWLRFAVRRLRRFLLSLAVLVTAAFAMVHLVPGDPVRAALGPNASQAVVDRTRAAMGLDHSLARQYVDYVKSLGSGDLGTSVGARQPVTDVLTERLPSTLSIAVPAALLTLLLGVPLGLVAGAYRARRGPSSADLAFSAVTSLFAVLPGLLLAVALVYVLAVSWRWFPVAGRDGLGSYVLPVAALAAGPTAVIARLVRSETEHAARADYVRTAQGKRLGLATIHLKHILPNVLTSALTVSGLLLGSLIAGTVVIENVFAWPGIGATIVTSITGKDYALVQGIVLAYGAVILLVNLLVDVALATVDPRTTVADR